MSKLKEELEISIKKLAESNFQVSSKVFGAEELAVKQSLQKLAYVLSQQDSKVGKVAGILKEPMSTSGEKREFSLLKSSLRDMTRRGQLTLIAENMDDSYLTHIKNIVENSNVDFAIDFERVNLKTLYNLCKNKLEKPGSPPAPFSDVLLRMYTETSPFYKKLNAILANYENVSPAPTDDEIQLAILFSVALHKAGLEKKSMEMQETPPELFRGQIFNLDDIKRKFEQTKELQEKGKLSALTPSELSKISIVHIGAKKALSTTANLKATQAFSGELEEQKGFVLHISNPALLGDFYNVKNISAYPKEDEFLSRIPDDIAMIPTDITVDSKGISHVYISCIRSENVILQNSTKFEGIKIELKSLVASESMRSPGFFASRSGSTEFTEEQIQLLNTLNVQLKNEEYFIKSGVGLRTLASLYQTHPNSYQKSRFDVVKSKLEEFLAVSSNLQVIHADHDPASKTQNEQEKIKLCQNGIKQWFKVIAQKQDVKKDFLTGLSNELNIIQDTNSSNEEIRLNANSILNAIKGDADITVVLSDFSKQLLQILNSLDMIEPKVKIVPHASIKAVEPVVQNMKEQLRKLKADDPNNDAEAVNLASPNP